MNRFSITIVAFAALAVRNVAIPAAQSRGNRMPISQMIGCPAQNPDGTWTLTDATEPVAIVAKGETKEPEATTPLGKRRFRLIGTVEEFSPGAHKGHKVRVKGLVINSSPEARVNITSLRHLAPTCP
ncbi:MAG: hypothetical protein HYZ58_00860 [Acidobacteria bacterium]|nr:hypothetical protein [Acidobacteriota bacterium]